VIVLSDLSKEYVPGKPVLSSLDLEIKAHSVVALVGPSGAGKSTLLKVLTGSLPITSGSARVLGKDLSTLKRNELRELKKSIGFIFQDFGLVLRASALENVLMGSLGSLRAPRFGVSSYPLNLRRLAMEQLDRVGIADQGLQRASSLSGGQAQRVGIARALMQKPRLLLADEPVSSLDPENAYQVMKLITDLAKEESLTVFTSLHQVDMALEWSDRIIGLNDGKIIFDKPSSKSTATSIGEIYRRVAKK
jgi:phosphonate transport system ATP-binding protein